MPTKVLNPDIVREARRRVRDGETTAAVAADLGFKKSTIYSAVVGHTWAHVEDPAPVYIGGPRGETNGKAKLTAAQVKEARRRAHDGEAIREISKDMPGGHSATYYAVRGYTWTHIEDPPPIPSENQRRPAKRRSREVEIPDEATPCKRCGVLTTMSYCVYCLRELRSQSSTRNRPQAGPHMGVV